jgi:peptide/nickel transport system substrate-binding protein
MIKKVAYFSLLFVLVLMFVGGDKPKEGGTVKIGIPAGVETLAPWDYSYGVRSKIMGNIYERLIATDWDASKLTPGLAVDWEVDEEKRIFTFRLREGIRFHNGEMLTADDVIASAEYFPGDIKFKTEKVDRMRVRFNVDRPASTFLFYLAQAESSIGVSSSLEEYMALRKSGTTYRFRPMGSGPFKFESWRRDKELVLAANKDYWGGRPYLSRLVYRVIPDHEEMIAAVEKGEIDLIDLVYPEDLARLKKNRDLVIRSTYGLTLCYLGINNSKPPFSDLRVRRAIELSLDKLTLTKKFFYGGYGIPTNRPVSPAFFGFPTFPKVSRYDPKEARKLLSEAGYPEGFSAKLLTQPFARPYLPDPRGCAEEVKKQLALVGIDVEILVPSDMKEYFAMEEDEQVFDLSLAGWFTAGADPDFMLTPLLGGSLLQGAGVKNRVRWDNRAFDEKILAARGLSLSDSWRRIKLYNEAIEIFNEELPFIPLFHTKMFLVFNKRVKGMKPTPSGGAFFVKAWIEE